jgi:PTH1 family peptidyl-tRNA hydrolase
VDAPLLIVGLGNPGPKYADNRHNIGFMVVDALAERWSAPALREKFQGRFTKATHSREEAVLLEPLTFMNLSGDSVQRAMRFFKIPLKRLLVIHDEMDLPFGQLRLKQAGGTAGHNGLKSIIKCCGGNGFLRLRFGIGRPRSSRPEGYVLSDFASIERAELPDAIERAAVGVESVLTRGSAAAMNAFNRR